MRHLFLLAIMLTGGFALANNFEPNVSSEIIEGTEIVTQTDVLSVQNDVSTDYQYQITETTLSPDVATCYFRVCRYDSGGTKWCTEWQEVPCNAIIIVVISPW